MNETEERIHAILQRDAEHRRIHRRELRFKQQGAESNGQSSRTRTEALIELYCRPGTTSHEIAALLSVRAEVLEVWSVTGSVDAIARVQTENNRALDRLIADLQGDERISRTRTQIVLSRLIGQPDARD